MLTGNEPVSTGNLRASLGNFSHHRAGACYEKRDGEIMKTEYVFGKDNPAVPIVTGRAPAVGGYFNDMAFVPEKPGIFEVSLSVKNLDVYKQGGNISEIAIIARVDGFDYILFSGSIDSAHNDINASKVIPVTETGVAVMAKGIYGYNEWGSFETRITDPCVSIIEI